MVEADIRYPADGVLALQGARALAREGHLLAGRLRSPTRRVVDRLRRIGKLVRIVTQIQQRQHGERINDLLVSLADPDARPIRKGKLGKPNEFGYVAQLAEVTANTRRGARA